MKLLLISAVGLAMAGAGCGDDRPRPSPFVPVSTVGAPVPLPSATTTPAPDLSMIYQDSSWFREVKRKLNISGLSYNAESGVVLPSVPPDVLDLRFQTPDGVSGPDAIEYAGAYACGASSDLTRFKKMNIDYRETAPSGSEAQLMTRLRVLDLNQTLAACPGEGITLAIKVRRYPERTLYRVYLVSISLESSS